MRKFTLSFLLGKPGLGSVFRKFGLSMIAILMTVAVFAQPQETYHVWAESASGDDPYCYRYDNTYEVDIYMRDFIKIDTFSLVLNYSNMSDFSYVGYDAASLHSVLDATGTFNITESTAGSLLLEWDSNDDPVGNGTIGETIAEQNEKTLVVTLRFSLDGYPHIYGPVPNFDFASTLSWGTSSFWNVYPTEVTPILTEMTSGGALAVKQGIEDVVVDAGMASCAGSDAVATVTSPIEDGNTYSFNGSSFTANPVADVTAPSTENTVRVMDGACVSYYKKFDVTAPEVLSFNAPSPVYTDCPGGLGDIEIFADGGTTNYTYYVIPAADWAQVTADLDDAINPTEGMTVVEPYASSNNVFERVAGTEEVPMVYYVAVQDANECQDIRNEGWWNVVEVIDTLDAFDIQISGVVNLECYNVNIGQFSADFIGGTPFADGYNIWLDGTYKERGFNYTTLANLAKGDHVITITDSMGCDYETTVTIDGPDAIVFNVLDHTDTGCEENNGTITLDQAPFLAGTNGGTFKGGSAHWELYTTSDFSGTPVKTLDLDEVATDLPPHVYYAKIYDDNGCSAIYENANGDNAIKIFTYEVELDMDEILCNGGSADVAVVISGENASHNIEYILYDDDASTELQAQGPNNGWTLDEGNYTVTIVDNTIGCNLVYPFTMEEPDPLNAWVNFFQTLPPSCPGNSDGRLVVNAWGGTPFSDGSYKYKMDDGDWISWVGYPDFAIDNEPHTVTVMDANECKTTVMIDLPDSENRIDFVDKIYTPCAEAKINLFNAEPGNSCTPFGDENGPFYFWNPAFFDCDEGVDMDFAYLNDFEWYGNPMEHFTGTITMDINIWTSDSGWVTRPLQGFQQQRSPVLYITDVDPAGMGSAVVSTGEVVNHNSAFSAGTYWLVVKDEWGCYSNIEKVQIIDPLPLALTEVAVEDAGCAGSTDGTIKLMAHNGRFLIPIAPGMEKRYQYVMTQQAEIFTNDNWWEEVTWAAFQNGDPDNDSLLVKTVQDGTYHFAVRDFCGIENPDLIQFHTVTVGGADAIEIDWAAVTKEDLTCNIWDAEEKMGIPSNDGMLKGLLEATSGGYGDYEYILNYVSDCDDAGALVTGVWPITNTTGDFVDLPAGCYTLTIEDKNGCNVTYELKFTQPEPLRLEYTLVYPSCFETHDGILRYKISGGTAPYEEVTENTSVFEDITTIPEERWYNTESEGWTEDGMYMFDRRVRADVKKIWIRDAKGCIYGPVEVDIKQPAKLAVVDVTTQKVSCNNQTELNEGVVDDGAIMFNIEGGWNIEETSNVFNYYVELWDGVAKLETQTANVIPESGFVFNNLTAGDYVIKVYEWSQDVADNGYENPVTTYSGYADDEETWGDFAPYQNSENSCFAIYEVTVEEPAAITYVPSWIDVQCHNTATGKIELKDITGGTPGETGDDFQGYLVGLEGPADYNPALQVEEGDYSVVADGITWFETVDNEFTFNNLVYGHYTIHIKDYNACWIYKESGEIENPDTLQIVVVEKLEDALCYGGKGKVEVHATGGVQLADGGYWYAVDSTLVPSPGSHLFPDVLDVDTYLDGLKWQKDPVFEVTAATWVGYVRDSVGCIAGFSTDENGTPILHHRTTVLEPDPIRAISLGQEDAECYASANGSITIGSITGGNGGPWTIHVYGVAYDGETVVDKTYTSTVSSDITLDGLLASTNKQETATMTDADYYSIVITDAEGCESVVDHQYVLQPEPFIVEMKAKQNSFICAGDQGGLFELEVVSGGTPFGYGPDDKPLYKYTWEAFTDEAMTERVDSLSDDIYGFTRTFNGYGDLWYRISAIDANDCEASADTFIVAPVEVEMTIKNTTCKDDPKASALVTATGTEGRSFQVWYKEIEDQVNPAWTKHDEWFTSSIALNQMFTYDTENVDDKHWVFMVVDTLGCMSEPDTMTFDSVFSSTSVSYEVAATEACQSIVTVTVNSGVAPFVVTLGDEQANVAELGGSAVFTVDPGMYDLNVEARMYCGYNGSVTVERAIEPMAYDTISIYVDDSTTYTYTDAGVEMDTVVYGGDYEIPYIDTETGCDVVLNLNVVEMPRVAPVLDTVTPMDTIADNHAIFEIVFKDSVTWNNDVEGYLVVTAKDSANPTLEIALTEDMLSEDGTTITVDYDYNVAGKLDLNTTYTVAVDSGIVMGDGAAWAGDVASELGKEWTFTTGEDYATDVELPTLQDLEFQVYPNPFNDRIKIKNYDKLTRVVLTNIAGQRVLDINSPTEEIRTGNLVTGVYVITLISNDEIVKSERIIKR
uniref:T9SS type A sorting domain-containing protein n=1 Tax=uncultured Draconibacterium sp. TaxID=1573823 RepID=UPI0032179447